MTTRDSHATGHRQQILVVDDSEDMRVMLGRLVERAGYHVLFAEDGQSSLAQSLRHHPDLVLMDLSLPDIDGWEAVRRLREMEAFRTIPIIAVTAHVSAADQERALAAGCTVYIGKPFKTAVLLQSIRRLLGGGRVTVWYNFTQIPARRAASNACSCCASHSNRITEVPP